MTCGNTILLALVLSRQISNTYITEPRKLSDVIIRTHILDGSLKVGVALRKHLCIQHKIALGLVGGVSMDGRGLTGTQVRVNQVKIFFILLMEPQNYLLRAIHKLLSIHIELSPGSSLYIPPFLYRE